ncbi:MAG TPA: hypothetical protein VFM59_04055 [Salinimicrobium sp.]|nr:hypothetical protein [Salinimicrobium sp.]
MKKSVYFLMMFLGLAFTGCEPMEDIHAELDQELAGQQIEGVTEYVLTEDDYDALDLQFGNFNSLDEARALIPGLLSEKFPVWGEGSLAEVTFDLYAPISVMEYTVQNGDYAAIGIDENYFSGIWEVEDFLAFKYPQAKNGTYVELTYRTLAEEIEVEFTDDDFDIVGEELGDTYPDPASSAANFNNFDRREGKDAYWSNEMILEAIDAVLSENMEGIEGQTYNVSYAIYDGEPGVENMHVLFDGNSYIMVGGTSYDVSNDDFDLIGAEFAEEYPNPASSAAQYNNFERREGNAAEWSTAMIVEALDFLLKQKFPDAAEGAQFDVTYRIYDGSAGTELISLILTDGEYVIDESSTVSTIMTTETFSYANGEWAVPFSLPETSYREEFGQRFANFDDEDEAIYKIGIYLESVFPYAEEGDFVPVAYQFYNGDETVTEYANFVFEDGEFVNIPSVIAQTLQFGHNGSEWEPDNTILYTLSSADFAKIGDALIDKYPGPADNAGFFGSFDRREGSDNYWSVEMLLEAVTVILNDLAPNPEEGQKYVFSFLSYTGSNVMETLSVIYLDGAWVLNQ